MSKVTYLKPWKLIKAPFCCYVEDSKGRVTNIIFPDGQELNTEKMSVIIHDNGIEFFNIKRGDKWT